MRIQSRLILAIGVLLAGGGMAPATEWVWWEAENAIRDNFPADHPFAPEHEILSGGEWIGTSGSREETLFAEYELSVAESGKLRLYARKFWKHGPFRWRFDDGGWREVDRSIALLDEVSIRKHLGANWVFLGEVELEAGPHRFRLELTEEDGAACFDCFLLSPEPFTPRGKLKPGEKYGRSPDGWFPFEPDADPFTPSPLDLRGLNEPRAGSRGFIRSDGDRFVYPDNGEEVCFWAVNLGPENWSYDHASLDRLARMYAKRGVNLVRLHGSLLGDDFRTVDPQWLDKVHYAIAAFKREGIYAHLSIYFQHWNTLESASGRNTALADFGYEEGERPFALHFINQDFQAFMKGWWSDILTSTNPYTGLKGIDDPALFGCEILNEDSYFFWTFRYGTIPDEQMAILEGRFGAWLTARYGSLARARQEWGGERHRRDDLAAGRMGFLDLSEIFRGRSRRAQDTAQFLAIDQRTFFSGFYGYLKNEIGFRGQVTASNWKTADARRLGPLDKWTNAGTDFYDRHAYYGRPFEEVDEAFGFGPGDRYRDRSMARLDPGGNAVDDGREHALSFSFSEIIYENQPNMLSEVAWPVPNRFTAEQSLLGAAYGRLQGTDVLVWFSTDGPTWKTSISSFWPVQVPAQLGIWPATALIYRLGLVDAGETVVNAAVPREKLFALNGSPVAEIEAFDAMQAAEVRRSRGPDAPVASTAQVHPLTHLVGQVRLDFSDGEERFEVRNLDNWLDLAGKRVESTTGELTLDWGLGQFRLDGERAQGFAGFPGTTGGKVDLRHLRIETDLEYLTAVLVPIDGMPVGESNSLLLQVMTEDRNFGWETKPADGWKEIVSTGGPPVVVREVSGQVRLEGLQGKPRVVQPLDFNGYPDGDPIGHSDGFALAPDTLSYWIHR